MNNEPIGPEESTKKAQAISDQLVLWWRDPKASQLTKDEMTQLIQHLAGPPAIWYSLPDPEDPYNTMEAWCKGELDCDADTFLDAIASSVGQEAISPLLDRRLSAIFRPLS